MPSNQTLYLELDKTGSSIDNRIIDEIHTTPNTLFKLLIPKYGVFYSESMMVYSVDTETNTETLLNKNVDYITTEILHKATAMVGKEISTVVLITKSITYTTFKISYQALGGHNQIHRDNLFAMLDQIKNPTEVVQWRDILNKPKGFNPAPHLQDAIDIYGLEYIRDAINRIDNAIIISDRQTHKEIVDRIDHQTADIFNENFDDIYEIVDTSMALVKSAEDSLKLIHDNILSFNEKLDKLNKDNHQLRSSILDYKATHYNDTFSNVANLLCKREHSNSGDLIDIPNILSPDDLSLYLESHTYNQSTGRWLDKRNGQGEYTNTTSTKPIKTTNPILPDIDCVRFIDSSQLTRDAGQPVLIRPDCTIITVAAPVPGTSHIKIDLFADSNNKLIIDTANNTGALYSTLDGSEVSYHGRVSRAMGSRIYVAVNTIASRNKDCRMLASSPYRLGVAQNGVMQDTLNTSNISSSAQSIGRNGAVQSADIYMLLIYKRLLSKAEIHAILTYIRIKYNGAVQYIENGNFADWDVGFGSDLDNRISFQDRSAHGRIGVTIQPISVWDTNNTYTHPGIPNSHDIKIDNNPYLLVLSKNSNKAIWRQTVDLDIHCQYEFKLSIVYGQISPPILRIRINGVNVVSEIQMPSGQSILRNYVVYFTPTTTSNTIEIFNLNESLVGNCFGIGDIHLQRKIYVN